MAWLKTADPDMGSSTEDPRATREREREREHSVSATFTVPAPLAPRKAKSLEDPDEDSEEEEEEEVLLSPLAPTEPSEREWGSGSRKRMRSRCRGGREGATSASSGRWAGASRRRSPLRRPSPYRPSPPRSPSTWRTAPHQRLSSSSPRRRPNGTLCSVVATPPCCSMFFTLVQAHF